MWFDGGVMVGFERGPFKIGSIDEGVGVVGFSCC